VLHVGKRITLKDIHNLSLKSHGQNDLTSITESLSSCTGLYYYTVFHKKGSLFVFFIIHSNDDQFTQNFDQFT